MNAHPYSWLKDELREVFQRVGFVERGEEVQPDVFGSAFTKYSNRRWELRLVWDGKEGLARLERRPLDGATDWSEVADVLTEGDLEGAEINQAKLDAWRQSIQASS